jgi:hypothetical protein
MTRKLEKFMTPVGVAHYPSLTQPDTKFNAEGVYKTGLIIEASEAEPLKKKLAKILKEFRKETIDQETGAKAAKLKKYSVRDIFEAELDEDGEETGNVVIRLKLDAVVTPRDKSKASFTQQPKLFDTSNADVTGKVDRLWGGSEIQVAGDVVPYAMATEKTFGISLRMRAVQIHSLNAGEANAEAYGFGEVEGGFSAPTQTNEEGFSASDDSDNDDF